MVFQCINICQVPREVLKTAAFGLDFQHLSRDLANVNAWKNMFDPYIVMPRSNYKIQSCLSMRSTDMLRDMFCGFTTYLCKSFQVVTSMQLLEYVFKNITLVSDFHILLSTGEK